MIFRDGRLSKGARAIATTIGLGCAAATFFLLDDLNDPKLWICAVLAILFGYGSAWSGLSEKWGFKPFTNDPLGWRKAKKSYEQDSTPESDDSDK